MLISYYKRYRIRISFRQSEIFMSWHEFWEILQNDCRTVILLDNTCISDLTSGSSLPWNSIKKLPKVIFDTNFALSEFDSKKKLRAKLDKYLTHLDSGRSFEFVHFVYTTCLWRSLEKINLWKILILTLIWLFSLKSQTKQEGLFQNKSEKQS